MKIVLITFLLLFACSEETPSAQIQELIDKAETSDKLAQYALGTLYLKGEGGVAQDYQKAARWLKLAAGQKQADAQYMMGLLYQQGKGVRQDNKKAMEWYLKAAQQNHKDAQFELASMYEAGYEAGELGQPNYNEAKQWYNRSLSLGNGRAAYQLGAMHLNGRGVQQNNIVAHIWFDLSTRLGFDKAAEARDAITTKMTLNELEESKRQSDKLYNQLKANGVVE